MRWHAVQLSPDIKPANKPATPKAMMRFPWEEPDKGVTREDCHITELELEGLRQVFGKLTS